MDRGVLLSSTINVDADELRFAVRSHPDGPEPFVVLQLGRYDVSMHVFDPDTYRARPDRGGGPRSVDRGAGRAGPAAGRDAGAGMRAEVVAGLRCWAQGVVSDEAAVELLCSCLPARFTQTGCAWVRPCRRPGWWWLDPDLLATEAAPSSAAEARVLALVVALLTDRPAARSVVGADLGRAAA